MSSFQEISLDLEPGDHTGLPRKRMLVEELANMSASKKMRRWECHYICCVHIWTALCLLCRSLCSQTFGQRSRYIGRLIDPFCSLEDIIKSGIITDREETASVMHENNAMWVVTWVSTTIYVLYWSEQTVRIVTTGRIRSLSDCCLICPTRS